MSSLRNAISRRAHKERSQPHARKKFGILEKHKDYVVRAQAFHKKEDSLRKLKEKAAFRNPDEFYFKMIKTRNVDGIHKPESLANNYTQEELMLMKTQDIGYVLQKVQSEKKKIEKLTAMLHSLDSQPLNKHVYYAEDRFEIPDFTAQLRESILLPSVAKMHSTIQKFAVEAKAFNLEGLESSEGSPIPLLGSLDTPSIGQLCGEVLTVHPSSTDLSDLSTARIQVKGEARENPRIISVVAQSNRSTCTLLGGSVPRAAIKIEDEMGLKGRKIRHNKLRNIRRKRKKLKTWADMRCDLSGDQSPLAIEMVEQNPQPSQVLCNEAKGARILVFDKLCKVSDDVEVAIAVEDITGLIPPVGRVSGSGQYLLSSPTNHDLEISWSIKCSLAEILIPTFSTFPWHKGSGPGFLILQVCFVSRKTTSSYKELEERKKRVNELEKLYMDMALQKELQGIDNHCQGDAAIASLDKYGVFGFQTQTELSSARNESVYQTFVIPIKIPILRVRTNWPGCAGGASVEVLIYLPSLDDDLSP
ncbi:hypothetical protein HHK36_017026 [Tetracentron sinense]|uniref:U3 small nucleolar RNA-associated protein 11 n=1 Tax=Tetracentron sinense TaxID=13715 RepID=A0A834Z2D5_TETSI|nr:hypothetical protein HHK36_017026 [Tetracentron sinense]